MHYDETRRTLRARISPSLFRMAIKMRDYGTNVDRAGRRGFRRVGDSLTRAAVGLYEVIVTNAATAGSAQCSRGVNAS